MRRKTKPRVVWLPPTNANSVDTAARSTWGIASIALAGAPGGPGATVEIPVVIDGNAATDPLATNATLSDIENSGYRLRRIVGKIFCFIGQTNVLNEDLYGITAGFIVRRTNPNTGVSLASATPAEVDVADIDNSADPWIWRRSWILSNKPNLTPFTAGDFSQAAAAEVAGFGPGVNYGSFFGSAVDGPHVDQKTARLVSQEERLFLDVSGIPLLGVENPCSLVVIYELRVLASMRVSSGNRRNASR